MNHDQQKSTNTVYDNYYLNLVLIFRHELELPLIGSWTQNSRLWILAFLQGPNR